MIPRGLTASALSVLPALVALFIWEVAARQFGGTHSLFPPVSSIALDIFGNHAALMQGIWRTLTETVLGFLLGCAFGFAAGSVFAQFSIAERLFFPLFVLSQTVPVVAFGAVIVIWFGNGLLAKVVIAFYLTFFPVTVNTHRGLRAVDEQSANLLRSFGASPWTIYWRLRVPSALPSVVAAILLGVSLSLIGAIVGEWFGDTLGLGILLLQAMYAEDMVRLWSVVVCCGALGAILYGVVAWLARRYVWWSREV